MKFRKKPVVIEAIQWKHNQPKAYANNIDEIVAFVGEQNLLLDSFNGLYIKTLEGEMRVSNYDWVIKGVKGEFYPCKPDIFEATYEAAE